MDASYYAAVGQQIASGQGWQEPFLWQYLDDPAGVPHPAHTYWMPLASLLTIPGLMLRQGFWGARALFLFLAALVPSLTMCLAWSLTRQRSAAWMAGVLALFPPFYLPYLLTTDTFVPYMLLGGLFLLAVAGERWRWLGLIAGLMHLTRPDGLLWLLLALVLVGWRRRWRDLGWLFGGYLLPMLPWYGRNLLVWGRLTPPGSLHALWLVTYNDLFRYPPQTLTFARWWASGPANWLQARKWALGQNLQTLLAVQGGIALLPFALWGAWRFRNRTVVRVGAWGWVLAFTVMTLVFPWAGARGGFFHAGAAVQPLFWSLVPVGLEALIGWGAQRRGWQPALAHKVFSIGLLGLVAVLGLTLFFQRVQHWDVAWRHYQEVETQLRLAGAEPDAVVMVNDPPGYFWANTRPAVAVPVGGSQAVRDAARRYGVYYLILESNHPSELTGWYENPGLAEGWLYLGDVGTTRLFQIGDSSSGKDTP